MTRRTWLFLATALLLVAALGNLGSAANAALPANSASAPAANVSAQSKESSPRKVDCADIDKMGIEKAMGNWAYQALVDCGRVKPQTQSNTTSPFDDIVQKIISPLIIGGPDKNLITGAETSPNVTQSETWVWANGNNYVATYNDSRGRNFSPIQISGASWSTDAGVTWTRVPGPQPFPAGGSAGDPYHYWSISAGRWYAQFFAVNNCGGNIEQWESTNQGMSWFNSGCVISSGSQDRFSGWVDNNPASPFYGRQYTSSNNFAVGGGRIETTFSTDNGATWSPIVGVTTGFERNVQMTGSFGADGTIFIMGMNEGGGGLTGPRTNILHRSTNGGVSWEPAITLPGGGFLGPGRSVSGYFATMYSTAFGGAAYWRHMGWGQPAVGPNQVVHYVYAMRPAAVGDPGNILYVRSTDNGSTWAAPIQLSTDANPLNAQWQPSMAANATGAVFASWYDEVDGATCVRGNPASPCYERRGRMSTDNGATWSVEDTYSDAVSPLPAQPDPGIVASYAGDYDYSMFSNNGQGQNALVTWTEGRVAINGQSQQDVFFDQIPVVQGTPTPTVTGTPPTNTPTRTPTITSTPTLTPCPVGNYTLAVGTGTVVPGTTLLPGSQCDDCSIALPIPFPFTFYSTNFNSVNVVSNGNLQFSSTNSDFTNACEPYASHNNAIHAYWDDILMTTTACGAGCGVYTSVSGTTPNRILNIEWRGCYYNAGACGGTVNVEARLYETGGRIDVIYATAGNGNASATGGVQKDTGSLFLQAYCNGAGQPVSAGVMHTYMPGPSGCPTGTPATATRTPTGQPTCPPGGTPGPIVFNGSIAAGDPTQTNRLFRDEPPSTCAAPQTCATSTGSFRFDQYTLTNTSSAAVCVSITVDPIACTGTSYIQSAAYLGTYNPAAVCTNYIGDIGNSPEAGTPKTYEVTIPAGATFVIVVNESFTGGCPAYTVTVNGLSGGGGCPTPGTNTPTPAITATPTPCVAGGVWVAGPNHPASPGIVRAVGVYFPANGRFYTMGGRTSDAAGSDLTNPYEFNPTTNTWVQKAAVFPDNQVNNMVCGVLTDGGTPYIYCVGGSAAGATTATARVFRYNPVTDAISAVAAPWPGNASGDTLPGGGAVVNNRLYTIGGFQINIAMTNDTWEFTPGTNAWVAKADLPVDRGYVPATVIGNMIYTGGGTAYVGGLLEEMTESFRYDPVANTYTPIAPITRATGETDAVTLNGEMYVLGGGRVAPNPSNEVNIYNPGSNSWRLGTPFTTARRNFPVDSNGTDRIWLAGGYAPTTPTNSMEIFQGATGGCPTPGTVTATATRTNTPVVPTNTATRTNTPVGPTNTATRTPTAGPPTLTATRTPTPPLACNIEFSDVPLNNPFRIYIRCLACRGIVSGYADGTFRPYNDVTRGQIAKMVSNSAGFTEAVSGQRYTDVPPSQTFYVWIMRLTLRGHMSGYNDAVNCAGVGIPCFKPMASATRGQVAKIVSNAAGFNEPIPAGSQAFTDVPPSHTFYPFIQRLSARGVISGYQCGDDPGEPCDPQGRPYYRPQANVTRGQTAKIVANTFFPECQQPGPETTPPARLPEGPANN